MFAALAIVGAMPVEAQTERPEPFDIAITVDDLPVHGALPPGTTRSGIARAHVAAFKRFGVREAFGFVNAGKITTDDDRAVLAIWRTAGFPLGNHTASHLNLDRAPTVDAWTADLVTGEPPLVRHMAGRDWRWLRFPNLASGATRERHDAIAAFLAARGYQVAQVSVAFNDWSYSDAYARCLAVGNAADIARMRVAYLTGVDRTIVEMKASSRRTFGRIVPQVLLTHLGGWSAVTLPEVLHRLKKAGARFVPLAAAQADPAYSEAAALVGGGSIITRVAKARSISAPSAANPSEEAMNPRTLCR